MVTAAACPRLFEYPPFRDPEHYVETTLFGPCLRASQKNTRMRSEHSHALSKTQQKMGRTCYVSRLSCVCTAVTMCQHHLRPSFLPLPKKKKEAKEARCPHAISKLSWVVKNTMCCRQCGVCWVVRETECHVGARFKNRYFVFWRSHA